MHPATPENFDRIADYMALHFNLDTELVRNMASSTGDQALIDARRWTIYLCMRFTNVPMKACGKHFHISPASISKKWGSAYHSAHEHRSFATELIVVVGHILAIAAAPNPLQAMSKLCASAPLRLCPLRQSVQSAKSVDQKPSPRARP